MASVAIDTSPLCMMQHHLNRHEVQILLYPSRDEVEGVANAAVCDITTHVRTYASTPPGPCLHSACLEAPCLPLCRFLLAREMH